MEFKRVKDHIEVYNNNKFLFSADTRQEAEKELIAQMNIKIDFKEVLNRKPWTINDTRKYIQ